MRFVCAYFLVSVTRLLGSVVSQPLETPFGHASLENGI